ncbi:MAG TPA: succinate dehydrogenase [Candidatus Binatia bacterium]|nr:succinate dehydrogenase [Candidatus Binatia bacterium]
MSAQQTVDHSSFFWRKLHSLSGIIPVGVFLAEHFWSNSYVLVSPEKYDAVSQELQTLPFRPFVEAVGIWIPILFHAGYGFYVWSKGKSNALEYPWMHNWMFTLQRWSGLVAFAFIGWHFYTARVLTGGRSNYLSVHADMSHNAYVLAYLIGVTAASFHLGNGLWNFLCKWGLVATARAQRAAAWLGAGVALAFSLAGFAIVYSARFNFHPFEIYVQK